jgi:hypothetical protein
LSISSIFARVVALVGGTALVIRRLSDGAPEPAWGSAPAIPAAKPQGAIPTLKMPTAQGWARGQMPVAAPGLKVNAFASGLKHPRWIYVLPNGDVLVAEATNVERPPRSVFDYAMVSTLKRAAAMGVSANRITLLRDADGDGVAESRMLFAQGLKQPFGMTLVGPTLYVANSDGVVSFPYAEGQTSETGTGQKVFDLPGGPINHHWTKNVVASPDRTKLYATVGSNSNAGENGLQNEIGRAAIWEYDLATGKTRIFASGIRNPNGIDFEPTTHVMWTVSNERDEIGNDLPPDFLTSVRDGAFYGWPWSYWGHNVDVRAKPANPQMVAKAIAPDFGLGAHTASLGLTFYTGAAFPASYRGGAFIGQHGSWNRKPLNGYQVVFIPFAGGQPQNAPQAFLTGFLDKHDKIQGRPVGVAVDRTGALLVADDVGGVVWRVTPTPAGAKP